MTLSQSSRWLKTIAWLRRNFKPVVPTYVRSVVMKDHGDTQGWDVDADKLTIRINKSDVFGYRIDTLLHEWAHAQVWLGAERHKEHSAEWGVAHANLIDQFDEWNYGRDAND